MKNTVSVRARFKGLNVQEGKTVMQFILDPEHKGALPSLAMMTGTALTMTLESDQQILFVDRDDGEVLDGQEGAFEEGPRELPPSAYEVTDDEADEGAIWEEDDEGAIWEEDEWPDGNDESLAA